MTFAQKLGDIAESIFSSMVLFGSQANLTSHSGATAPAVPTLQIALPSARCLPRCPRPDPSPQPHHVPSAALSPRVGQVCLARLGGYRAISETSMVTRLAGDVNNPSFMM